MPLADRLVLLALVAGLLAFPVLYRRGTDGRRLAVATLAAFYGLALVAMLGAHCIEIAWHTVHGHATYDGRAVFGYDWRSYSLLLFGVLLVIQGARLLRHADRLVDGDPAARGALLRTIAVVLAIVGPTIPIHAVFGVALSALGAVTFVVVAVGARPRRATASVPATRHDALSAAA